MDLTTVDLQPFLRPNPLKAAQRTLVDAWAPVLAILLTNRYGDLITADVRPVFVSAAADAIQRRLDKPNAMVSSQSVNGASVSYSASLLAWFAADELDQLDELAGRPSGIQSVRTPASVATWWPNRYRPCAAEADDDV